MNLWHLTNLKHNKEHFFMYIDRLLRLIAGAFTLLSLALAHYHDPRWLWFTAFVGANLLQSAFTRWCLMEDILRKLGLDGPKKD